FPRLLPGHVLEVGARAGVVQEFGKASDVPFFERYYLGGLYSLRGFPYRGISPREIDAAGFHLSEPVGGDTYWFGSAEYSIPIWPPADQPEHGVGVRFAVFYDIG